MKADISKTRAAWTALVLSFFAALAIFIPYVGYSTQIPAMMHDLHIDYASIGLVESISALTGGLCVYFSGFVIDRFGAKLTCVVALILSAFGQIAFAYAPSFPAMLAVRAFQGAIIPLLFVGPYNIALRWAEESNRMGIFMGVMLSTDGVGSFLAAYVYSLVLAHYGWRVGSLYGAGLLLVAASILAILLREAAHNAASSDSEPEPLSSAVKNYLSILLDPKVIVASLYLSGAGGLYTVSIYWVPTLLLEAGWSEASAGLIGSLFPIAGIISSVIFGMLSDHMGHRRLLVAIGGLGTVVATVGATIAVGIHNYLLLAISLPVSGLFAYGGVPLGYVMAADSVGIRRAALSTGCIMGTGFLLGGMLYPFALGYIRELTGLYTLGFAAASVSLIAAMVMPALFITDKK
jgi:sugar phosphate permease